MQSQEGNKSLHINDAVLGTNALGLFPSSQCLFFLSPKLTLPMNLSEKTVQKTLDLNRNIIWLIYKSVFNRFHKISEDFFE